MVDGVYRYTGKLQELWDASLQEVLDKGADGQSGDATKMVEEQEVKYSDRDHYDFSKPFDQQVDDWMNGTCCAKRKQRQNRCVLRGTKKRRIDPKANRPKYIRGA